MLKKVLGVGLLLAAALFLLFAVQRMSSAPSLGYVVGMFLPTVMCTLLGLFCLQKPPVSPTPPVPTNDAPQQ